MYKTKVSTGKTLFTKSGFYLKRRIYNGTTNTKLSIYTRCLCKSDLIQIIINNTVVEVVFMRLGQLNAFKLLDVDVVACLQHTVKKTCSA